MFPVPVPFSTFGSDNEQLYWTYLTTFHGACPFSAVGDSVGSAAGVVPGDYCASRIRLHGCDSRPLPSREGGGAVDGGSSGDAVKTGVCDESGHGRRQGQAVGLLDAGSGEFVETSCLKADDVVSGAGESPGVRSLQEAAPACTASSPVLGPNGGRSVGRGRNYERNQAKRLRRKKVASEVSTVPEWRRGAGPVAGYFSACGEDVQVRLRESRARMLVAQNELRAKKAEAEVARLDSPEGLMQNVLRVVRLAGNLKNKTKDLEVGGWAEAVAASATRSAAESAPSSVPSLESVGLGASVSVAPEPMTGDPADEAAKVRKLEYDIFRREIEERYDSMDCYSGATKQDEIAQLRLSYVDVVGTFEQKAGKHAYDIISQMDISPLLVEKIAQQLGVFSEFVEEF